MLHVATRDRVNHSLESGHKVFVSTYWKPGCWWKAVLSAMLAGLQHACTIQPELGWIMFLSQKHLKVVEVSSLLLLLHTMFFRTDPLPPAIFSRSCSSQGPRRRQYPPCSPANTPGIYRNKSVSILPLPQWDNSDKTSFTFLGSQKGQEKKI